MRLHHGDHLAFGHFPRGFQHRGDFHRVVAVVVDDDGAIPFADAREAPLDAAELGQRRADRVVGNLQFGRHRNRRGGVERVVPPRHRQLELADGVDFLAVAIAKHHRELRLAVGVFEIGEPHVGLRIFSVGDDAPVDDAAGEPLHDRMVGAHHHEAVERHILHKGDEGVLHVLESLGVVEVLGVDVGDDGDVGGQLQEGAVGLVCFDHHPVAGP